MCQWKLAKMTFVQSTPGTCIYPFTNFLDLNHIYPSGSSLLLNAHFTGTGFLTLYFTVNILVRIQAFFYRKLLISDNSDIFHKCPVGLDIAYWKVSGSPESI